MRFTDRTKINVSDHIEKKGRFSYLSWVYALGELQNQDDTATWEYQPHIIYPDGSMMVTTTVTAFGKTLQMLLPVMDHNNKAIKSPDAFAINKAYMRCLAKNVAAHGIGLYIFAGEDLPNAEDTPPQQQATQQTQQTTGTDKPWFNDFNKLKDTMVDRIGSGEQTPQQIIDGLSQNFKLNKKVREDILALGATS